MKIYNNRPDWLDSIPLSEKGVKLTGNAIDVELDAVFYQYSEPPATIKVNFNNDLKLSIYIHSDKEIFAVLKKNNIVVTSREKTVKVGLPDIKVLPQIVPLLKDEKLVSKDTLEQNKFSKRT